MTATQRLLPGKAVKSGTVLSVTAEELVVDWLTCCGGKQHPISCITFFFYWLVCFGHRSHFLSSCQVQTRSSTITPGIVNGWLSLRLHLLPGLYFSLSANLLICAAHMYQSPLESLKPCMMSKPTTREWVMRSLGESPFSRA